MTTDANDSGEPVATSPPQDVPTPVDPVAWPGANAETAEAEAPAATAPTSAPSAATAASRRIYLGLLAFLIVWGPVIALGVGLGAASTLGRDAPLIFWLLLAIGPAVTLAGALAASAELRHPSHDLPLGGPRRKLVICFWLLAAIATIVVPLIGPLTTLGGRPMAIPVYLLPINLLMGVISLGMVLLFTLAPEREHPHQEPPAARE